MPILNSNATTITTYTPISAARVFTTFIVPAPPLFAEVHCTPPAIASRPGRRGSTFALKYSRKPFLCRRTTVSGPTMKCPALLGDPVAEIEPDSRAWLPVVYPVRRFSRPSVTVEH
jgi:hypothetical protein